MSQLEEPQAAVDKVGIDLIAVELKFGKFQLFNIVSTSLVLLLAGLSGQGYIFTARDTTYRCLVPECDTFGGAEYHRDWLKRAVPYRDGRPVKCVRFQSTLMPRTDINNTSCQEDFFNRAETEKCVSWVYDEGYTIIREFNIPCQTWKSTLVGTTNSLSRLISYTTGGILADKYGRKNVMIIMAVSAATIGACQSFSFDYWMFLALEVVNVIVSGGAFMTAFVLGIELLSHEDRVLGSTVHMMAFSSGTVLGGVLAWTLPYWRHLLLAINLPSLLVISAFFSVSESYRWLYVADKKTECILVVKKAAMVNNITLSAGSLQFLESLDLNSSNYNATDVTPSIPMNENKLKLSHILSSRCLVFRLFINCVLYFLIQFVYGGLSINSGTYAGTSDIHLNYILVCLSEFPGHITSWLILDRYGRKKSLIVSLLFTACACLLYLMISQTFEILLVTIYMCGKIAITVSSDVMYVYASEQFPTGARNSTLNLCALCGSLGFAVAAQMILFSDLFHELPIFFYACGSLVAALLASKLPETVNASLPNTIQEAENIGKADRTTD